jgi:energy-coupling factor transport system permease protein
MGGLCIGAYGLLNGSSEESLGLPALLAGSVLCALGLALGSRRVRRSQYRPDPWRLPEWLVVATGIVPAAVFLAGTGYAVVSLNPSTNPLSWPTLPVIPALAILVAALAGFAAPPPLRPAKPAAVRGRAQSDQETAEAGRISPRTEVPA